MSLDNAENGYWISEVVTWKIYAGSEAEARAIWQRYWNEGESPENLDMNAKNVEVEADWDWISTVEMGVEQ